MGFAGSANQQILLIVIVMIYAQKHLARKCLKHTQPCGIGAPLIGDRVLLVTGDRVIEIVIRPSTIV